MHLGLVVTRPRCTEYDRASISFRRYCANSARRKSPHAQVSSRVIGQENNLRVIGRGTGSIWNAALSYKQKPPRIIIDDWIIPVIISP